MNGIDFEKTMPAVDEISRTYDNDPTHSERVATLALELFDALTPLHKYGPRERRLLEIASRMHDIKKSKTASKNHHKLSGNMILNLDIPGFNGTDKVATALVARYHTKALPNAVKHHRFAALGMKKRNLVEWLAGILRVADALDSSHAGVISRLNLQIDDSFVTVHLQTKGSCWNQIKRARRKGDLLVKKSGRSLLYQY
jgi:exopolyphosphatase/guanosine-5'-triphosphate,3'-diphosphate pyrophosphatase